MDFWRVAMQSASITKRHINNKLLSTITKIKRNPHLWPSSNAWHNDLFCGIVCRISPSAVTYPIAHCPKRVHDNLYIDQSRPQNNENNCLFGCYLRGRHDTYELLEFQRIQLISRKNSRFMEICKDFYVSNEFFDRSAIMIWFKGQLYSKVVLEIAI